MSEALKTSGRNGTLTFLTKSEPGGVWSESEIRFLMEFLKRESGSLPRVEVHIWKPNVLVLDTGMWDEKNLKHRLSLRLDCKLAVDKRNLLDNLWVLSSRPTVYP